MEKLRNLYVELFHGKHTKPRKNEAKEDEPHILLRLAISPHGQGSKDTYEIMLNSTQPYFYKDRILRKDDDSLVYDVLNVGRSETGEIISFDQAFSAMIDRLRLENQGLTVDYSRGLQHAITSHKHLFPLLELAAISMEESVERYMSGKRNDILLYTSTEINELERKLPDISKDETTKLLHHGTHCRHILEKIYDGAQGGIHNIDQRLHYLKLP